MHIFSDILLSIEIVAFYLACILTSYLAFYPAFYLTFFLASIPACYLASILTFSLTWALPNSNRAPDLSGPDLELAV